MSQKSSAARAPYLRIVLLVVGLIAAEWLWTGTGSGQDPAADATHRKSVAVPDTTIVTATVAPVPSGHPALQFLDASQSAGLNYRWQIPGPRPLTILQTIGNGCAFLDYNNDGNLDILLVGPKLALFKGDGRGHFTDVTEAAGLSRFSGHYLGCAVGDYDHDGYDDIYISGYRTGLLLHNEHGTAFRDVTQEAGLKPQPWGSCCAWAETERGSGRLDLFVGNYLRFGPDPGIPQLCLVNGIQTSCGPPSYEPLRGVFYRNVGHGRFIDDSNRFAIGTTHGAALGAAFAPSDKSASASLAIANDEQPADLVAPQESTHAAQYANTAARAGIALNPQGNVYGGMGVDWGDYDNDGRLDLFIATFENEPNNLFHCDGDQLFSNTSAEANLAPASRYKPYVAFGCKFVDLNNDGWLDLVVTNGHTRDNVHTIDPITTYQEPTQIFLSRGGASTTFDDVSNGCGADVQRPVVGRGLAIGDYDNDGRMDLLVVDSEGAPLLLHNESAPVGHWLGVRLIGKASNSDGMGALVTATVGRRSLLRLCHTDGSYLSASDRRVHFGLGAAKEVDVLRVRWPSGRVDTLHHVPADQYITLREGSSGV